VRGAQLLEFVPGLLGDRGHALAEHRGDLVSRADAREVHQTRQQHQPLGLTEPGELVGVQHGGVDGFIA
jgi:hypothetical protein